MKSKVIAAAVAGGLLVGAAFVTSAVSAPGTASAQEDAAESTERGRHGMDVLSEVLSDLVDDETISQEQADAILAAVGTKAEEIKAQHEANKELIEGFLEDDVITSDELAQLPDNHPFNDPEGPFAEVVADGELTRDELREARPHSRRGAFRRGAHFGALLDDGGIDKAEYNELPDEHPLKQIDVSEYFDDDELITPDELREIHEELKAAHGSDDSSA